MEGKDNLSALLQQRFQGHEVPVDASVWEGISGQLAATAAASDPVSELFKDRFSGHELPVDPALWQNIATQLGHGAAVGTATGSGFFTGAAGWVGGGIAAVVLAGVTYLAWPEASAPAEVAAVPEQVVLPVEPVTPERTEATPVDPDEVSFTERTEPANEPVARTSSAVAAPTKQTPEGPVGEPTTPEATMPADVPERIDVRQEDSIGPYIPTVNRILERTVEKTLQHPAPGEPEPALPEAAANTTSNTTPEEPQPFRTAADDASIFIPNVFSPNSDRINDQLRAEGVDLENFQRVSVRIYSAANNQLVFSANDMSGWDGRDLSGQPCPDGYYFYALEAVTNQNRTITRGQTVRLFR